MKICSEKRFTIFATSCLRHALSAFVSIIFITLSVTAAETKTESAEEAALAKRNELAMRFYNEKRYEEAEKEWRAYVDDSRRILGAEHRKTLICRCNAALALQCQGKLSEAVKEFREVLAIRQRKLGPEHQDTLSTRRYLYCIMMDQFQLAEAEKEIRDILAIQERTLGPDHPDPLSTRLMMAARLATENKIPESLAMFKALSKDCEEFLGEDDALTKKVAKHYEQLRSCQRWGMGWLLQFFDKSSDRRSHPSSDSSLLVAGRCIAATALGLAVTSGIILWVYQWNKKRLKAVPSPPPEMTLNR
ncbi:MAG: tetratricopeptide repeat protein [Verrucomicrobia bacterium]|nr:tetratricopeptide repeat protein [Verrucomicrobiota bacterium]